MAWQYIEKPLSNTTYQYHITQQGRLLTTAEWLRLLETSREFGLFFREILKNSPFEAFFWECPPHDSHSVDVPFEFVLIESKQLPQVKANQADFEKYFEADRAVVHFENLRADACLIVPNPVSDNKANYTHIANFVRKAPVKQVIELFQQVAQIYYTSIKKEKRWLSTSGLGVPWLHVRIDSRPKYYCHKAYKL